MACGLYSSLSESKTCTLVIDRSLSGFVEDNEVSLRLSFSISNIHLTTKLLNEAVFAVISDRSMEGSEELPGDRAGTATQNATPPRLMITKIVCKNFKSYAGEKVLGPFHKVKKGVAWPFVQPF